MQKDKGRADLMSSLSSWHKQGRRGGGGIHFHKLAFLVKMLFFVDGNLALGFQLGPFEFLLDLQREACMVLFAFTRHIFPVLIAVHLDNGTCQHNKYCKLANKSNVWAQNKLGCDLLKMILKYIQSNKSILCKHVSAGAPESVVGFKQSLHKWKYKQKDTTLELPTN